MNAARHHTAQADNRETFESVEAKLAKVGHRHSALQMTSSESRERAQRAANMSRSRCTDCPCDGMGAVSAAVLLVLGAILGCGLTLLLTKGLP